MISADVAVATKGHSAAGRRLDRRGLSDEFRRFARGFQLAAAGTLSTAMATAGGLVLVRQLAGSLTEGLSLGGMAAATVLLLAGVFACDRLSAESVRSAVAFSSRASSRGWPRQAVPQLLSRLGMALCLWGVSGNATTAAVVVACTGMAAAVAPLMPRNRLGQLPTALHRFRQGPSTPAPVPREVPTGSPLEADAHQHGGFVQQQIRHRTAAGGESIRGTVVVSFRTGDRLAVAHVGFCPPLEETPAVQLTTAYDELDAVVGAGEILPWGIRVECRLEEAAEDPFDIPVDFVATSPRLPH